MPTIQQLPSVASVGPADELPVSQAGVTNSVSVGTLLSGLQPAILAPTGTLLGRLSLGLGGPEPVSIGTGVEIEGGTLVANGADHATFPIETSPSASDQLVVTNNGVSKLLPIAALQGWLANGSTFGVANFGSLPVATSMASTDLVAISQGGTNAAISYANLLDGVTIDQANPAGPASDTDAFWTAQGSGTMFRQTLATVWSWLATKLPTYKLPVVELSTSTTLDGTVHNGRVLVCSQPIMLSPAFINMSSGFFCEVLNLSSGNVTFATGIVTSTSQAVLPPGQMALLRGVTYSGGNVVFAAVLSIPAVATAAMTATQVAAPGQVTNLSASTATSTSVNLTWSPPASGGTPSGYTVQFAVSGSSSWSIFASGLTGTTASITGLVAGTTYVFQVLATNAAGSGPASASVSASTTAASSSVSSIVWNLVPSSHYSIGSGAIGVNVHVSPSNAAVQVGLSTSSTTPPSSWTAATYVNTDLWGAYIAVPSVAGTYYVWAAGMDNSALTVYPTSFTVS